MAGLPADVGLCTVTGRIATMEQVDGSDADPDSVPAAGTVTFTPSVKQLRHAGSNTIFAARPITVALDGNGDFTAVLVATDDPDLDVTGWTYAVSFNLTDGASLASFDIEAPDAATVSLASVAPPAVANGALAVTQYNELDSRVTVIEAYVAAPIFHGDLEGLTEDDHLQYALADGSRGAFATSAQGAKADSAVQPGALGRYVGVNAQTGTAYTPALADVGALVTLTDASAIAVTLPQDSGVAFAVGDRIDFAVLGAGMATFIADAGSTIIATPSAITRDTGSATTAVKVAADTWLVIGDLA